MSSQVLSCGPFVLVDQAAQNWLTFDAFVGEGYDGSVSARAQMVLWRAEGYSAPEIARIAGTTKPTVYK
jgi:hypothetical protein